MHIRRAPRRQPAARLPMHLELLASFSADIESWRARLLCTPHVWRRLPPMRAFASLSHQDETPEAWSYVTC
ncbi:hypothetical protein [Klebsiella pneumoniae]|uniref:Uncharacterized protein n=1 Tax=Pseudomonas monteilii TaxID=76759 RepID=A0A7X3EZZ0_9PSED|nr:hypothetical protein [Klebsiella pneumoniae]ELA0520723.1 hypothetical protein [Klebsiella pneumoniae]MVF48841.1 hypothetical protein [Pseudomonas monteilii]TXR39709.1 hypothetical protein FVE88_08460 [Pseudomonas mendocina]